MRRKIIFFWVALSLVTGTAFADTNTIKATQLSSGSTSTNKNAVTKKTESQGSKTSQDDSKSSKPEALGDDLSIMVDTSNASYEALLADAERILADHNDSKKPSDKEITKKIAQIKKPSDQEMAKRIAQINKHVDNKVVVKKDKQQQEAMQKDVKAAGDILKRHDEINENFKDSYGPYQNESAKDYITKEAEGSSDIDPYKMKNYKELLNDIKTPNQIAESFDQIDNDGSKSKDGYSVEDITTVGDLTGQNVRLKKCLIMKTYGGGTWRTYCQPLKKPTQCPDYDWQQLSTLAIMYC